VTAHQLITDIFSRVQDGVPNSVRRITRPQLDLLRTLIAEDKDRRAVHSGGPGVTVWSPTGRDKYVITEDFRGKRHALERFAKTVPTGMGLLF
jgi:hypothetical protein